MKKTLLLFILSLLFTGCIERGQTLKPVPVHHLAIVIEKAPTVSTVQSQKTTVSKVVLPIVTETKIKKDIKIDEVVIPVIAEVKEVTLETVPTKEENNFFTLSEETKNNISGFFIIIIGIIILL